MIAALVTVKLCTAGLIAAIGLGSTFTNVTYLLRRPALLARSLLGMYALVPLLTALMVDSCHSACWTSDPKTLSGRRFASS